MTTETFQEYRYAPPNVRAVRWDGRLETARAIIAETAERFPDQNLFFAQMHLDRDNQGFPLVKVFFHGTEVRRGDFIVIEPDGRIHVTERDEFRYHYQEAAS